MAFAYVSGSYATANDETGSDTSLSITPGATPLDGNLMVLGAIVRNNAGLTTPSGWTLATSFTSEASTAIYAYYKIASSESGGAYTATLTTGDEWSAVFTEFSGVDSGDILEAASSIVSTNPTSSAIQAMTNIVTATNNCLLVLIGGMGDGSPDAVATPVGSGFTDAGTHYQGTDGTDTSIGAGFILDAGVAATESATVDYTDATRRRAGAFMAFNLDTGGGEGGSTNPATLRLNARNTRSVHMTTR